MKRWMLFVIGLSLLVSSLLLYIFDPVNVNIRRLRSNDELVRERAVRSLEFSTSSRAVKPLLDAALNDSSAFVRVSAARALFELDYQPVTPEQRALLLVLAGRPGEAAKLGSPAVEPLADAVRNDDSAPALCALASIEDSQVVGLLISAMSADDWFIRMSAIDELKDLLMAALKDGSKFVRHSTTDELKRFQYLLTAALKDDSKPVRHSAAVALGEIGDPRSVEPLIVALKESNGFMDGEPMAEAIIAIGPRGVEALGRFLKDDSWPENQMAIEVLGYVKDTHALKLLVGAVKSKNIKMRYAVIMAMTYQTRAEVPGAWEEIRKALLKELSSDELSRVSWATLMLIKLGREEMVPELIRILYKYGNKTWAELYLNCGQPQLRAAAENWAVEHDFVVGIDVTSIDMTIASWGSFEK